MSTDALRRWLCSPRARQTLTRVARLTGTQVDILRHALSHKEPWRYSELASDLGLERQHVHQTLRALEQRELVAIEAVYRRYRAHAGPALQLLVPDGQ